ncbi:MAG: DNA-binding protein WhiA [Lachnospiraceae bacterium]|nr:DNA-binding protein WhiA [Lachnospiraceae bacterium]
MSFSSDAKNELIEVYGQARHCQLAELSAIVHFAAKNDKMAPGFVIPVENEHASQKYFTLLKKTFNINSVDETVIKALKLPTDENGKITTGHATDRRLLLKDCCRRAFLRGAFLSSGSVSDPSKGYHLEFICRDDEQAGQILEILGGFGIEAHTVERKNHKVVYIKEGEAIVDLFNLMGAHMSLMEMENARIIREISNTVNRRVNCETANITKTANAAAKQLSDIEFIRDNYGLARLPDKLRAAAEVRLNNPEASLKELGELLDPPVGKSGMNHRLRSLSEIADNIRSN